MAILALALSGGCRTVPIRDLADIRIPSGLDSETIELAIIIAVVNPPAQAINLEHTTAQIANEVLAAIFGRSKRHVDWFIESRDTGVIYAGRQRGSHFLSVSLKYDLSSVHIDIVRSEALDQNKSRIHRVAYKWIDTLEQRLRIALSHLAARRPMPPVPSK